MSEENTLASFHLKTFSHGTRLTGIATKLLKDAYIKGSGVTLATLHRDKHYIKLDQLARQTQQWETLIQPTSLSLSYRNKHKHIWITSKASLHSNPLSKTKRPALFLANNSINFWYLCIFKYTKEVIVNKYIFKSYKTRSTTFMMIHYFYSELKHA